MNVIWTISATKRKSVSPMFLLNSGEDKFYIPANINETENLEEMEKEIHDGISNFFAALKQDQDCVNEEVLTVDDENIMLIGKVRDCNEQ